VKSIGRNLGLVNDLFWKEGMVLPESDVVIQLSGASIISHAWTEARKKEILDSRVETTKILVNAILKSPNPPPLFISGSAVGIYPTSETETYDEDSTQVADNFAGEVVKSWEEASLPLENSKTRRVVTRLGIVLGNGGGMLANLFTPFRFGLGGPIGSGEQYMPWIHIKDVANLCDHIIQNPEIKGVLNAVAPAVVTNREFAQAFGTALFRPALLPLPAFAVRLLFGERAFLLLEGQDVRPKRTLETGFNFEFPDLESALADVVRQEQEK